MAMSKTEEYMKYKDLKQPLGVRLNDLLSRMTLEEKIGQMVQIERSVASAQVINKYFIGKIHSFLFFLFEEWQNERSLIV